MKSAWLAKFASVTVLVILAVSPLAQACKDCPFPSRIADGRWLMPNGALQIEIDETAAIKKGMHQVKVVLRDTRTGDIVAKGMSIQRQGRRTVVLQLQDRDGRKIEAFVHYLDDDKDKIEAKFTCSECKIEPMLD